MTVVPSSNAASQGHAAPTTSSRSSGRRSACSSNSARGRISRAGGQSRASGAATSAGMSTRVPRPRSPPADGSSCERQSRSRLNASLDPRRDAEPAPPAARHAVPAVAAPSAAGERGDRLRRTRPGRWRTNAAALPSPADRSRGVVRSQCRNAQALVVMTLFSVRRIQDIGHWRPLIGLEAGAICRPPLGRGHSSVGRAPEWHSGGQGFDSPWLHHGSGEVIEIARTA